MPRGRIARWILEIQSYQFTVIHKKGTKNADADALSRISQTNSQAVTMTKDTFFDQQQMDPTIKRLMREGIKTPFLWHDKIIYRNDEGKPKVPVIPSTMITTVLKAAHDGPTGGHFGFDKTYDKARQQAWWNTMRQDIDEWCRSCDTCQKYNVTNKNTVAPMEPIQPQYAGQIWACDLATLIQTERGNKYMIVFTEYLTKWTVSIALPSTESNRVAQILIFEIIFKFGTPTRLITGNGANLVSEAMTIVCKRIGIKRSLTSVEHPQADGVVERIKSNYQVKPSKLLPR
jgi:hypothetical protein